MTVGVNVRAETAGLLCPSEPCAGAGERADTVRCA